MDSGHLTNRELKKWYQQPFVLAMGIIQPILWLALLGKAMNIGNLFSASSLPPMPTLNPALTPSQLQGLGAYFSGFQSHVMQGTFGTADYFSFMAMSMVAFTVVFTTAFVGMSVVWDKRLGFMNKVLSTPVSRSVIILSKVFAASVRALFQAAIVMVVAFALGITTGSNFSALSLFGVFAIVFLISVGLSSFFTALTLRATRMEMPQAIFQLITLPLMFASSAYFPICADAKLAPSNSKRQPNILHHRCSKKTNGVQRWLRTSATGLCIRRHLRHRCNSHLCGALLEIPKQVRAKFPSFLFYNLAILYMRVLFSC